MKIPFVAGCVAVLSLFLASCGSDVNSSEDPGSSFILSSSSESDFFWSSSSSFSVPKEGSLPSALRDEIRYSIKSDFYTAFSNQYSLMYKDWQYPVPVSVSIFNNGVSFRNFMVRTWISGWSDTGSVSAPIDSRAQQLFGPSIIIPPEKYRTITVPQQANLRVQTFALENNQEVLLSDATEPIILHPPQVNGCEYLGLQKRQSWYAVWVTPNMDSITSLHTQMLKRMSSFGGYQTFGEADVQAGVRKQVKTIYELLGSKKISYVSNTDAGSCGQKIKYPSEVLRTKQANCIEGVTLFASLLESIGIRAVIVLVPGHAFLGWYNTKTGTEMEFLETTYAWSSPLLAFSKASSAGLEAYYDAVVNNNVQGLVDISEVRYAGVMPGQL